MSGIETARDERRTGRARSKSKREKHSDNSQRSTRGAEKSWGKGEEYPLLICIKGKNGKDNHSQGNESVAQPRDKQQERGKRGIGRET